MNNKNSILKCIYINYSLASTRLVQPMAFPIDITVDGITVRECSSEWHAMVHRILGVSLNHTSMRMVTKKYHELARIHHPDKNGGTNETFQNLNEAYQSTMRWFEWVDNERERINRIKRERERINRIKREREREQSARNYQDSVRAAAVAQSRAEERDHSSHDKYECEFVPSDRWSCFHKRKNLPCPGDGICSHSHPVNCCGAFFTTGVCNYSSRSGKPCKFEHYRATGSTPPTSHPRSTTYSFTANTL